MLRFAAARIAAVFLCAFTCAVPATAQESPPPSLRAAADAAVLQPIPQPSPAAGDATALSRGKRPAALVPLYISFSTLQVLDAHSTSRAINTGGIEANPVMKGVAGSDVGMLAVKAAGTAGLIYASERMWKKNKTAAVIFMVAANVGMTWVVQHNYRAGR